jgi:hypothetical protein
MIIDYLARVAGKHIGFDIAQQELRPADIGALAVRLLAIALSVANRDQLVAIWNRLCA